MRVKIITESIIPQQRATPVGTLRYLAPELVAFDGLSDQPHSFASDVYAVGAVFWTLLEAPAAKFRDTSGKLTSSVLDVLIVPHNFKIFFFKQTILLSK